MTELALIGGAHIHTPGFINMLLKRKDVAVTKVWDPDAARAKKRAEALAPAATPGTTPEVVADFAAIYANPAIKGVIVCTETNLHEKVVIPAAAAEKHLFVEKPLGMTGRDSKAMADAISKAGVMFQTGYFRRGEPALLMLKDLVAKGAFGKITRARASNCHSGALGGWFDTDWRWMADPKIAGCGAFGDLGTHVLDILIWILGPVSSVNAMLDKGTGRYGDCDELGEGLLRFANGTVGTLAASWDDMTDPMPLFISGTEGYGYVQNGKLHVKSTVKFPQFDGTSPLRDSDLPKALPHAFELFLDAVTGKAVPLVDVHDAAYRVTVMEALYKAAASGTLVPVSG